MSAPGGAAVAAPAAQRRARGTRNKELGLADLAANYHVPINEAARNLGVCVTVLKQVCRELGVQRWPYRKVKKIDDMVRIIGGEVDADMPKDLRDRIDRVQEARDCILSNPNSTAHKRLGKVKSFRAAKQASLKESRKRAEAAAAVVAAAGAVDGVHDATADALGSGLGVVVKKEEGANGAYEAVATCGPAGVIADGSAFTAIADGAAAAPAGVARAWGATTVASLPQSEIDEIVTQALDAVHAMFPNNSNASVIIAAAASASASAMATAETIKQMPELGAVVSTEHLAKAARTAACTAASAVGKAALDAPGGWIAPALVGASQGGVSAPGGFPAAMGAAASAPYAIAPNGVLGGVGVVGGMSTALPYGAGTGALHAAAQVQAQAAQLVHAQAAVQAQASAGGGVSASLGPLNVPVSASDGGAGEGAAAVASPRAAVAPAQQLAGAQLGAGVGSSQVAVAQAPMASASGGVGVSLSAMEAGAAPVAHAPMLQPPPPPAANGAANGASASAGSPTVAPTQPQVQVAAYGGWQAPAVSTQVASQPQHARPAQAHVFAASQALYGAT